LEIWKQQFGGGRISADLLKTQLNLYKNQKYPFKDKFIASANTITNWVVFWKKTKHQMPGDYGSDALEESISFSEELAKELIEEDMKSLSDELDDLDQENSTNFNHKFTIKIRY
ncbi:7394_t:CDS:2, partial [Dentiscutata erythropus]